MKNILKTLGILVLLIWNIGIGFHLVTYVFDWKIDFLNINPSDKPNPPKLMVLDYPPSGPTGPMIVIGENGMTGVSLSVDVYLTYTGTLATGTIVDLATIGFLYPEGQQKIDWVSVGFEGSSYYLATSNTPAQFRPQLENSDAYTQSIDAPILGTITWDTQGDYYPFIILNFKNGSAPLTVNYQDQNHKIHVSGSDVVQQEYYNRKNTAIIVDGILLGVPSAAVLILNFSKRKPEENENTHSIQSKSNKGQPYYKVRRKKSRAKKHAR